MVEDWEGSVWGGGGGGVQRQREGDGVIALVKYFYDDIWALLALRYTLKVATNQANTAAVGRI